MSIVVPFNTYFGDSIQSNLPDVVFGLILSFLDLESYDILCRLNAYLQVISTDDFNYLSKINYIPGSKYLPDIKLNCIQLHSFINIMRCMPLLFQPAKTKKLNGQQCKHYIEHLFSNGVAYWGNHMNDYYFTNKKFLNGVQRYSTFGKLRITGVKGCCSYIDRLVTVLAFILSGFTRIGEEFLIKDVRHTKPVVFQNRHLTINKPIEGDLALTF
jgi:hypothetical protein